MIELKFHCKLFILAVKFEMLSQHHTLIIVCVLIIIITFNVITTNALSCPLLPTKSNTTNNVNDLSPTDIKVIGALGDSITAGMSIFNHFMEDRGWSWSIGGNVNATTLPNILQSVSSRTIFGASQSYHIAEWPGWKYHESDYCNGAQSASIAQNLLSQIDHIYSVLENEPSVNIQKDWKLFTILIGANNVCGVCDQTKWDKNDSGDKYEVALRKALEKMELLLPRSFVNLVMMFNVSQVYTIGLNDPLCLNRHKYIGPYECECVFGKNDTARQLMDETIQNYNQRMVNIAQDYKNRKLENFAVVVQPYLQGMKIPSAKYLSTLDCFHPNILAHESMAIGLWNNLITPAKQKKHEWIPDDKMICPDVNTRLYTY
jgi:phospholipase B1